MARVARRGMVNSVVEITMEIIGEWVKKYPLVYIHHYPFFGACYDQYPP
jgi:hypothetical protein